MQSECQNERRNHRGNLAPGVDAPPIAAKHIYAARSRADLQYDLPSRTDRSQLCRYVSRENHQQYRHELRNMNVVALRSVPNQKTPVKILDDVRRSPV